MTRSEFTIATGAHDRFRSLFGRRVTVDGVQVNCIDVRAEGPFLRMVSRGSAFCGPR